MQMEDMQVNLYSRKILIKSNCRDLLPNYMRFVKGVVDCEDLPLNISRENYQDSQLIAKLKNILTKRVLKLLTEEAEKDEAVYLQWYNDF
jgi:TNF receptor-associated protein 1